MKSNVMPGRARPSGTDCTVPPTEVRGVNPWGAAIIGWAINGGATGATGWVTGTTGGVTGAAWGLSTITCAGGTFT